MYQSSHGKLEYVGNMNLHKSLFMGGLKVAQREQKIGAHDLRADY